MRSRITPCLRTRAGNSIRLNAAGTSTNAQTLNSSPTSRSGRSSVRVGRVPPSPAGGTITTGKNPPRHRRRRSVEPVKDATLKVCPGAPPGLFATHKEQFNADLLDFLRS
jgi:hypothetical protein